MPGRRRRQSAVWDQRLDTGEPTGVPNTPTSGEDLETSAIRRQALDRALSSLSEDQRLPVVLHDVEGLAYQEIADVLDIPVGTVMSRIFRGRQRLRTMLEELRGPRSVARATGSHAGKVAI